MRFFFFNFQKIKKRTWHLKLKNRRFKRKRKKNVRFISFLW